MFHEDLRRAKGNTLREPHKGVISQSQTQEELPPSLRFGDASRDALSSSPKRAQVPGTEP